MYRVVAKWFNVNWERNLNKSNDFNSYVQVAYIPQEATFFVLHVLNECGWYFVFNDSFCNIKKNIFARRRYPVPEKMKINVCVCV